MQGKAGSKLGTRSSITCHPTIRAQSAATGPAYKVMSFNACTDACSGWSGRSAAAREMLKIRQPDVLAVQEADDWSTPPSGLRARPTTRAPSDIFYKTSRFDLVRNSSGVRAGEILMRAPNRYAVWAELGDRDTGKRMIFVSAHTRPRTPTTRSVARRSRR